MHDIQGVHLEIAVAVGATAAARRMTPETRSQRLRRAVKRGTASKVARDGEMICTKFEGRNYCLGREALEASARESQLKTLKFNGTYGVAAAVRKSGGRRKPQPWVKPLETLHGMAAAPTALAAPTSASSNEAEVS